MTLYLPAPAPYQGPERCPRCVGAKVTGERYQWPGESGTPFVVDVICPECLGCGRAEHIGCVPLEHGEYDADDPYWDDEDDEGYADDACPSCHGRTWWACQGFTDNEVYYLRMPCGCAESLMVEAE